VTLAEELFAGYSGVMYAVAAAAVVFIAARLFFVPCPGVMRAVGFAVNALTGAASLLALHLVGQAAGFYVALNSVSLAVSALLGLPGALLIALLCQGFL